MTGSRIFRLADAISIFARSTFEPLSSSPALVKSAVVLPHSGSYEAMSARYSHWIDLPVTMSNAYLAPSTGSNFIAFLDSSGTSIAVFDSRLDRFLSSIPPIAVLLPQCCQEGRRPGYIRTRR